MAQTEEFQRARRPEQQELRRQAILDAARDLLTEQPAAEISLREIARRLGGSKSGIVRYYETREALFLELLNREMQDWVEDLDDRLPTDPAAVADVWARSLAQRPVLCALWSILASVLEHNVSPAVVREFKLSHHAHLSQVAGLVSARVPGFDAPTAAELVDTLVVLAIGLWPFANPAPAVAEAITDPRLASSRIDFVPTFRRTVEVLITGLRNEKLPGSRS